MAQINKSTVLEHSNHTLMHTVIHNRLLVELCGHSIGVTTFF